MILIHRENLYSVVKLMWSWKSFIQVMVEVTLDWIDYRMREEKAKDWGLKSKRLKRYTKNWTRSREIGNRVERGKHLITKTKAWKTFSKWARIQHQSYKWPVSSFKRTQEQKTNCITSSKNKQNKRSSNDLGLLLLAVG